MSNQSTKKALTKLQQVGINEGVFCSDTLKLREIAATILRLHSLEDTSQLNIALNETQVRLPLETGHCSGHDPAALCLRPNDFLLFSEQLDPGQFLEQLRLFINPENTALFDNSDGLATFRLSGPGAPWLLNKLSGLDFQSAPKEGQHCTRTRMAHAAVVVHYHQTGNDGSTFVFDLLFDRSLAKYMWELLTASANHADDLTNSYD